MGQQQLLLLVLASIIIGLMTLYRVQATKEAQRRQIQEALRERAFEIGDAATDASSSPFKPGEKILAPRANASCVIKDLKGGKGGLPENSNGKGKAKGRKKGNSEATVSCDTGEGLSVTVKVSLQQGRRIISINGNSLQ